jgi:hypothetical protein
MRLTVFAATLAFLLWGTPAFAGTAPDFDSDGVGDDIDNCSDDSNPAQDDTDLDQCGNICDADYDNDGAVGFADFGEFSIAFATNDEEKCHEDPAVPPAPGPGVAGCTVGFADFGIFANLFGTTPGPSGTTSGTAACP